MLAITNTGAITDTFTAVPLISQWPVTAPAASPVVPPGSSVNFPVWVTIPQGATLGSSDQASVALISLGNRAWTVVTQLITTAVGVRLALPVLRR
jgi:hypothetical protein